MLNSKNIQILSAAFALVFLQACGGGFKSNIKSTDSASQVPMNFDKPSLSWASAITPITNSRSFSIPFVYRIDSNLSVKSLKCKLDTIELPNCGPSEFTASGVADGDHTLSIFLVDSIDQTTEIMSMLRVDATAPVVSFMEKPASVSGSSTARFSFNASDALSAEVDIGYQCSINAGAFAVCTAPMVLTNLAAGDHSFRVKAADKAGNVSAILSFNWKVDLTQPTLTLSQKPNLFTSSRSATLAFSGTSFGAPLSSYQCKVDSGVFAACSSPITISNLPDGSHTFTVQGTSSGGVTSAPLSYSWTVDLGAPSVTISQKPANPTTQTSAQFAFMTADSGSGIASTQCKLDGASYSACTSPVNFSAVAVGSHQFTVMVTDKAGNSQTATHSWMVQEVNVPLDGSMLYATNCAGCHGALATSAKKSRTSPQITLALAMVPAMSSIKLTSAQIEAIALALVPLVGPISAEGAADKYFPIPATPNKAPKRLVRLTQTQLDATTQTLLPKAYTSSVSTAMAPDPRQTNYEFADILNYNSANIPALTGWLDHIVAKVLAAPTIAIDCTSQSNSTSCLTAKAREFIIKAFRGDVSDAKITEFTNVLVDGVATVGLAQATANFVDVILSSPQYLFREEFQVDSASQLVAPEKLQLITYSLSDAPAEKFNFASGNAAALVQTASNRASLVETILASTSAREKLQRFFNMWLEVKEADEFNITTADFPEFTPQLASAMVDETGKFLKHHLTKPSPKLSDLTQAKQSFIAPALAGFYGVTVSDATGNTLVDYNPAERLGIFSQAAVVVSHSGPNTTRLVKRGVFFARKVLCSDIAAPPPGVVTELPSGGNLTERQRVEAATNQVNCLGCHATINPLGFFQENFSTIGKWRTLDNGLPIDSSVRFSDLDEGLLISDGPVETLTAFTNSMKFKQCFVRQMFRFYMGREEKVDDNTTLHQMFLAFMNANSQDILAPLRVLANSPKFSER